MYWLDGVRVGKPDSIPDAESGVAVQRNAERPSQQLILDHLADRLAFQFHRAIQRTSIPRKSGAKALPPNQEGNAFPGVQQGVAHQVDAVRVGARTLPHAAWIDDGHEYHANGFQLSMQHSIPLQAHHQTVQVGDKNFGTDPFKAMNTAKKADRGNLGTWVPKRDGIDREMSFSRCDPADHARFEVGGTLMDDALQFRQFRQFGWVQCQVVGRVEKMDVKTSSFRA